MDKLQDPWLFAGAATLLMTAASYVWAQVGREGQPAKAASKTAMLALFSLLVLTWIAHGVSAAGGPLIEPFSPE